MSARTRFASTALGALSLCLAACGRPPGDGPPPLPDQVTDFATLYATSCAGCHGADGTHGSARPLADPLYLALIGDEVFARIVAEGVEGTLMPGFSQRAGGLLTDEQVRRIAEGAQAAWGGASGDPPAGAPAYAGPPGDAARGAALFASACARCHGADGEGGAGARAAGSVVDPSFLALTSDQALRSAVLFGRVDLGVPDWRTIRSDAPLGAAEIADLVAWLASHRVEFPGQLNRMRPTTESSDG